MICNFAWRKTWCSLHCSVPLNVLPGLKRLVTPALEGTVVLFCSLQTSCCCTADSDEWQSMTHLTKCNFCVETLEQIGDGHIDGMMAIMVLFLVKTKRLWSQRLGKLEPHFLSSAGDITHTEKRTEWWDILYIIISFCIKVGSVGHSFISLLSLFYVQNI